MILQAIYDEVVVRGEMGVPAFAVHVVERDDVFSILAVTTQPISARVADMKIFDKTYGRINKMKLPEKSCKSCRRSCQKND